MFSFELTHTDGPARCGVYRTPHGDVATPAFMPVGTAGTVKGVTPTQLAKTGATMILANTYHLQVRPSADVVAELGGLHRFMAWDGPILTDSGGYQVFSLAEINRVTDEGVEFRSHVDGAKLHLGPKSATQVQNKLGADVIMAFDECVRLPAGAATLAAAVDRTIRWAQVCKETHGRSDQAMFGIVQGGLDVELRHRCAEALTTIGFDGYAIGGLSVGESHEDMVATLAATTSDLPEDRPRYLMGVGTPRDLLAAVATGIDLFDCVMPTRNGRNSQAFTAAGVLRMRNECHRLDDAPLEKGCDCEACGSFSRGYIRHLFNAGEMLGPTLLSIHNLRFYQRFMQRVRELIRERALARIPEEFPIASRAGVTGEKEKC